MKIRNLLLFSVVVILASCSKDEDPKPKSEDLVGPWSVTAIEYTGTTTTTGQGLNLKADFTGTGKDINVTTTFSQNPNMVVSQGSYTIVMKTTMMGQTQTEEYPLEEVLMDGSWSLDGNTLTITNGGASEKATVVEQTATTLKLKSDLKENFSDQGMTVSSDIHITYTFKKK